MIRPLAIRSVVCAALLLGAACGDDGKAEAEAEVAGLQAQVQRKEAELAAAEQHLHAQREGFAGLIPEVAVRQGPAEALELRLDGERLRQSEEIRRRELRLQKALEARRLVDTIRSAVVGLGNSAEDSLKLLEFNFTDIGRLERLWQVARVTGEGAAATSWNRMAQDKRQAIYDGFDAVAVRFAATRERIEKATAALDLGSEADRQVFARQLSAILEEVDRHQAGVAQRMADMRERADALTWMEHRP
jgi:hypothetical protein